MEVRRTIETWLRERRLEQTIIHTERGDYVVGR